MGVIPIVNENDTLAVSVRQAKRDVEFNIAKRP